MIAPEETDLEVLAKLFAESYEPHNNSRHSGLEPESIAARIPLRWIGPADKAAAKYRATADRQLREMRLFDGASYPFFIELNLYGDKAALVTFDKPDVLGVIIENAAIAESLRSLYQLVWDSL